MPDLGAPAYGLAQQALALAQPAFNNPAYARLNLGLFGDSITHNGFYSSGTSIWGVVPPEWYVKGAQNNASRSWGWASWVGPLSMQRMQVVRNWAVQSNGVLVPGTSPAGYPLSVQITEALQDPNWSNINVCAVLIGTNDCLLSGGTPDQVLAGLAVQLARLKKPVILITSPPNTSQPQQVVSGSMWVSHWLLEWRTKLKRFAETSGGWVRVVDAYSLLNQPTATVNDSYASGMSLSDGIHPNNAGAFLIGQAVVQATFASSLAGDVDIWPSQCYLSSGSTGGLLDQLFLNSCFGTASGGSGTGTIAGSLTVTGIGSGSATGSVAATTIPNGVGNMQTLAITSTAAGDGVQVLSADMHAAGVSGATPLAAGDQCYAQALVRVRAGGIMPRNICLYLTAYQSPNNYYVYCFQPNSANEVALPAALGGQALLLRTPLLTMPSGARFSNIQANFSPVFAGAGSCTIDIGNFEVRRFQAGTTYLTQ